MPLRASSILALVVMSASAGAAHAQVPVCADSLPFTGDTVGAGYVGPGPRSIFMPQVNFPRSMNNGFLHVRFLVNTTGVADSIEIVGFVDPKYDKTLRDILHKFRFVPARLGGCRRQGWYTLEMTLDPGRGRRQPSPRP